jgi:hypothetical protein
MKRDYAGRHMMMSSDPALDHHCFRNSGIAKNTQVTDRIYAPPPLLDVGMSRGSQRTLREK